MEKHTGDYIMKAVTLKAIRAHTPCAPSWKKLLVSLNKTKADDTEVGLEYILDLLGLDDALWALRALPESDDAVRLLVCDLVAPAMKYSDDPRPAEAVRIAREYASGNASLGELDTARYAARASARYAAWATARYVAWAAAGAAAGAGAPAWAAVWASAQWAGWAVAGAEASDAAHAAARKDQSRIFRDWLRSDT